MGVVYKALDRRLNRLVAIKTLPARSVSDPDRRERFVREARAASALEHPNIVTIYEIEEIEGQYFIAMQYVPGKTIRRRLARGNLPLSETLHYAIQVADALARAHDRGIVHRDLKPDNVMVTPEGQVKVLDFGLATLSEPLSPHEALTREATYRPEPYEGLVAGTLFYMSPEQALGKKVDGRSDIFSFGSLLYEMVTGWLPFRGASEGVVLNAILHNEPEKVSSLAPAAPVELEKLIARALRKDPDRRLKTQWNNIRAELNRLKQQHRHPRRSSRHGNRCHKKIEFPKEHRRDG